MEENRIFLSVIIPVYNEESNLIELHQRLSKTLEHIEGKHEIIYVDDGSDDRSCEILCEFCRADSRVKILRLTRNFGQHPAVSAGFFYSRGDIVAVMDADLQYQPEEIPRLIEKLKEGYDIVYGVRKKRNDSILRKFLSTLAQYILTKFLWNQEANVSSFFVVTRQFVDIFKKCSEREKYFNGLFAWLGAKSASVAVEHAPRKAGSSHYSAGKLVALAVRMVLCFTDYPLKLAGRLGLFLVFIGILFFIFSISGIVSEAFQTSVNRYSASISIFLNGLQLIFLGIFGEYMSRIYTETRGRPDFVVREFIENQKVDREK